MKIKIAIILIVLAAVMMVSGCMNQASSPERTVAPETGTVQETEKTLPEKGAAAGTGAGETGASKEPVNDPGTEPAGEKAAVQANTEDSSTRPADQAKISITGAGVKVSREFTLTELKQLQDVLISASYFSRGTEKPGWGKTAHTGFEGVLLYELLANHIGLNANASQVKVIAEDGYTQVFDMEEIQADYMDETDDSKKLRMIIAWKQDGQEYDAEKGAPFRLVMGQQFEGDYNRQKWVNNIARIIVE